MKIKTVNTNILIPIQYVVSYRKVQRFLEEFDEESFEPAIVLEYPKRPTYYLIGDGHHRACCAYLAQKPLLVKILETNKDVRKCQDGAFFRLERKEDFLFEYNNIWRPRCECRQIKSVDDLVRLSCSPLL